LKFLRNSLPLNSPANRLQLRLPLLCKCWTLHAHASRRPSLLDPILGTQGTLVSEEYLLYLIGGNFGDFSNQEFVREQFIVYEKTTSHSIYQHLRRERQGKNAHFKTHATIYLSKDLRSIDQHGR